MTTEELEKEFKLENAARLLVERGYVKGKSLQEVVEMLRLRSKNV